MKLNLGGNNAWKVDGWENLDIQTGYDLNEKLLTEYKNNTAELIYFSHALEHLPWKTVPKLLAECNRVLKPNGMIRIVVPDMDILSVLLVKNDKQYLIDGNPSFYANPINRERPLIDDIKQQIGHCPPHEFLEMKSDSHKSFFTFSILNILLFIAGFKEIYKSEYCDSQASELEEEAVLNVVGMPTRCIIPKDKDFINIIFYRFNRLLNKILSI